MDHVSAVLAEQQAVVVLLMKRLWLTDQRNPGDAETLTRALYSHLVVLEQAVIPVFRRGSQVTAVHAAVGIVAGQLAVAVKRNEHTGGGPRELGD